MPLHAPPSHSDFSLSWAPRLVGTLPRRLLGHIQLCPAQPRTTVDDIGFAGTETTVLRPIGAVGANEYLVHTVVWVLYEGQKPPSIAAARASPTTLPFGKGCCGSALPGFSIELVASFVNWPTSITTPGDLPLCSCCSINGSSETIFMRMASLSSK